MQILVKMKVLEWLLRPITSYLEKQTMCVRFRGVVTTQKDIPGSAPQGILLGGAFGLWNNN